ncbi:MAG: VWA domain-containing protein [Candidatus Lokiarchaeota archaeon]|nr:VWA domain-containing protein [Candidatus Lokiarchaeota archaeon]
MKRTIILISVIVTFVIAVVRGQDESEWTVKSTPTMNIKIKKTAETRRNLQKRTPKEVELVDVEINLTQRIENGKTQSFSPLSIPTTIVDEDFESFSYEHWQTYDGFSDAASWGATSTRSNSPDHSLWCVGSDQSNYIPNRHYPNFCNSWFIYGPIDLSEINWAIVTFNFWLESELDHDYLFWMASEDGENFYGRGISGQTDWKKFIFNLADIAKNTSLTGKSEVWIAFAFYSDEENSEEFEGAYLDDICIKIADLKEFEVVSTLKTSLEMYKGIAIRDDIMLLSDASNEMIHRMNMDSEIIDTIATQNSSPCGIEYVKDTNFIAYLDHKNRDIVYLYLDIEHIRYPLFFDSPFGLALVDSHFWISGYNSGQIYELRANKIVDSVKIEIEPDSKITGLTWSNQENIFWVANETCGLIYKLNDQKKIDDYYLTPGKNPQGLAFYGGCLWCVAGDSIFKMRPKRNDEISLKIRNVNISSFPLIECLLEVRDCNNHIISDLNRGNYDIREEGIRHKAQSIKTDQKNINAVLVLDFSDSMKEEKEILKSAALAFVDQMRNQDSTAIILFSSSVIVIQDLTSDRDLLEEKIEKAGMAHAKSALYDAMYVATNLLENQSGMKAVLAITDEKDTASDTTKMELINYAQLNNTQIYIVGAQAYKSKDIKIFEEIADSTGGDYFPVNDLDSLSATYQKISSLFIDQYQISYKSQLEEKDGTRRSVILSASNDNTTGWAFFRYFAPKQESIKIWIDNYTGISGEKKEIPIYISDVTYANIYSAELYLSYNPQVLEIVNVSSEGTVTSNWLCPEINSETGKIDIIMAGSTPLSGNGELLKLELDVFGAMNSYSAISFDSVKFNEGSPNPVTEDGYFQVIGDSCCLSGRVGYFSDFQSSDMDNLEIILKTDLVQDKTLTDSLGCYKFCDLCGQNIHLKPIKNTDDKHSYVNSNDASLILRHLAKKEKLSPYQKIAADVSGDSTISALDASYILRYCIYLLPNFPIDSSWTFVPNAFRIDSLNWFSAPRKLTLSNLDRGFVNQDFHAIAIGDVDGRYTEIKSLNLNKQDTDLMVDITDLNYEDKQGKIDLSFRDLLDVYSLQLEIAGISEDWNVVQIDQNRKQNKQEIIYDFNSGILRVAIASAEPINEEVFSIIFDIRRHENEISGNNLILKNVFQNGIFYENINKEIKLINSANFVEKFALSQNYPNPFNSTTTIKYQIAEKSHVGIEIFNLVGQRVKSLVNERCSAGSYQVNWDGTDDNMNVVPSGLYIVRMKANDFVAVRKVALLK